MSFRIIDLNAWKRRPYYEHYMHKVRCAYTVTLNIEVDELVKNIKARGLRSYPVQIFMLSKTVNAFPEFRMALNREGSLGCWETTHPAYTVFNRTTETFSSLYTPFTPDFTSFYDACIRDMAAFRESDVLFPQNPIPENLFTISSLPWLGFTAFNLTVYDEGTYLPPIFTIGRYLEQDGKKQMPLSIQVHHAVCDGYHVGKFAEALQDMAANSGEWLQEKPDSIFHPFDQELP